jgi:hypothetical protein
LFGFVFRGFSPWLSRSIAVGLKSEHNDKEGLIEQGATDLRAERKRRGREREREMPKDIPFKDIFPVTYFLQPRTTSHIPLLK